MRRPEVKVDSSLRRETTPQRGRGGLVRPDRPGLERSARAADRSAFTSAAASRAAGRLVVAGTKFNGGNPPRAPRSVRAPHSRGSIPHSSSSRGSSPVGEADMVADGQVPMPTATAWSASSRKGPDQAARSCSRGRFPPVRARRPRPGRPADARTEEAVAAACSPNTSAAARPPAYARWNTPPASAPAASRPGITLPDSSSARAGGRSSARRT